ncbi:beta-lactamase family protein [Cardiobacterium sp. AH-315-I02]|nr:beta-lactamase family protein [Cardiobacterium sp. AH-315-I02]
MRQSHRFLLVLFIAFFFVACASNGGHYSPLPLETTPAQRQAHLVAELDRILDVRQSASQAGVSVIVRKDGVVVYNRSKGMADIKTDAPITFDTSFELASVSKPITAIAVMQLMERGLLNLNDSVLKWLPELPMTWHNITIKYLLSHRAGIPGFAQDMSIESFQTLDGVDNQKIVQHFVNNDGLLFLPGIDAYYSNSNYVFLAEIIARSSGMSYSQYLNDNIFLPLGMYSTFVYGIVPPVDTIVALNYGSDSKVFGITLAMVGPYGIHSSASDLILLVDGLLSEKLVMKETLRLMTSPHSGVVVPDDFYGYGWYVSPKKNGLAVFMHSGESDGFRTSIKVNYQKGVDYVILGNNGDRTKKIIDSIFWVVLNTYE